MATSPLAPLMPSDWDEAKARHLLNRAGFGVPRERLYHLAKAGPREAVSMLVDYEDHPTDISEPEFLIHPAQYRTMFRELRDGPEEDRQAAFRELRKQERVAVARLQAWWFERMATAARPLEEKMALFWHGHFATSAQKVQSSYTNYQLNALFRSYATGNFKRLATKVGQSPAMLRYLDNNRNVKGKPNENWARELMELFTLGVGNYTEDDIKESARAFTGWTFDQEEFQYVERRHDFDEKTFMGERGNFDGWDIIEIIFQQRSAAEYISRKLFTFFAYENPETKIVQGLAQTLRENNFEIKPVLRQLFRSKAFYSERAMGTQIKSPVQFVIQLTDDLNLSGQPYLAMARQSAQLGQGLFYPPNVAGWEGGRAWINANTLLMRYNMPKKIIMADLLEPDDMMTMDMQEMRQSTKKNMRERLESVMSEQSPEQRKDFRKRMRAAKSQEERRNMMENAIFTSSAEDGWDVAGIFNALEFSTAVECVEALEGQFLSNGLSKDQRAVLADALGANGRPKTRLTGSNLSMDDMTAALHLLFSMAEYQVC